MEHVSLPSKLTMGSPPDSSSVLFCGRNRATTLMLFALDMAADGRVVDARVGAEGGRALGRAVEIRTADCR